MADHQFQNTTVFVRDPAADWNPNWVAPPLATPPGVPVRPAQVGACVPYILQHLLDLRNLPFGAAFFNALINLAPKRQVVQFIGIDVPNENSIHGGGIAGICKKMRSAFEFSDWDGARCELNFALHAEQSATPAHDLNWFADQLLVSPLHRWNPATTAATSPLNPGGALPGAPLYAALKAALVQRLTNLKANSAQLGPNNDQDRVLFDLMVIVLKDRLRNGPGNSSMINYNPMKTVIGSGPRAPQCALFHELVHAYYNAQGAQLSTENSESEAVGRYFELMAVGLPPFQNEPYSENRARTPFGALLRPYY
jgi:hypothetical protein